MAFIYFEGIADYSQDTLILAAVSLLDHPAKALMSTLSVNPSLSAVQKETLLDILDSFRGCFTSTSKVNQALLANRRIITEATKRPVHQHAYRVSQKEQDIICYQVQQMLKQPSTSPWASLVVSVKKKNGTLHFCMDYQK